MKKAVLGVIIGKRGFFPDHLCHTGRNEVLATLEECGVEPVILPTEESKAGTVQTLADARRCAALFKSREADISGVLVTLPNFGEEKAIADALRLAGLNVPVLIHAFPDDMAKMGVENRRDSFCGKISLCNNLKQYGLKFSLPSLHTQAPGGASFKEDLLWFLDVCRTVTGLRRARIGALGARPAAFNTVRYSEKLLEKNGISCETLDLSEAFGMAGALKDYDAAVREKAAQLKRSLKTDGIPEQAITKMAKLGVVVDRWIEQAELSAIAIQCWTAMEEYYGVVPCSLMSLWSEGLVPAACEVDVAGAVSMLALQLASGQPAALLDWNNNYHDDPEKAVLFHCGNLAPSFFHQPAMGLQKIIAGSVGDENAYGTVEGRIKPGPFTFARLSTADDTGQINAYIGEGEFTADPLETFGSWGVAKIPRLQELLQYICRNGFEHHVAVGLHQKSTVLAEAFRNYLGWQVYVHK